MRYKNPFDISERPGDRELAPTPQAAYLRKEFLNLSCNLPPSNVYHWSPCFPLRSPILLVSQVPEGSSQVQPLQPLLPGPPAHLPGPGSSAEHSFPPGFPKPPPSRWWEMDAPTAGECLPPSTPRDSDGVPWVLALWNRRVRVLASKLYFWLKMSTGDKENADRMPVPWAQTLSPSVQGSADSCKVHATDSVCMRCGRGPAFNQDPAPLPLTFPGKETESPDKGRGEPRGAVLKQLRGGGICQRPEGRREGEARPGGCAWPVRNCGRSGVWVMRTDEGWSSGGKALGTK